MCPWPKSQKMASQRETLLTELKTENLGGAAACALKALDCFTALADEWSPEEAHKIASEIVRNKPEIAPLLRIDNSCLEAKNADDLRRRIQTLRAQITTATETIAEAALKLATPGSIIATTTQSSTTLAALLRAGKEKQIQVLCSESRPGYEGQGLAQKLAAADIPVTLSTDAALLTHLPKAHAVWVGADAIGKDFFVNKVGTLALCLGAKHYGIPVYVLADTLKILPANHPYTSSGDHPAEEVWKDPKPNITVVNPYFEKIPKNLISDVITECKPSDELMKPLQAIAQILGYGLNP